MYKIGCRIRMFRERKGLSQTEFAAAIKQSNSTVSNWERGLTRPNVDVLVEICEVLAVPADDLLDILNTKDGLSKTERLLISAYREKAGLRNAVNILLGIEANDFCDKK